MGSQQTLLVPGPALPPEASYPCSSVFICGSDDGRKAVRSLKEGFEVGLPLSRVWKDEGGALWFEGVASSTSLDKQQERMTENAIRKMATFTGIDLLPSHQAGPLEELGTVTETYADNQTFRVAGVLDEGNPEARRLFEKVSQGKPYQLSVGGRVTRAFWAHDDELGKRIKHIEDVELDHVALCRPGQAANPDTYLQVMAKSAAAREDPLGSAGVHGVGEEGEREGLALRLGRALLEALWPFAKSKRAEEEQAAELAQGGWQRNPQENVEQADALDMGAEEVRKLRERSEELEKAIQVLAERLERLESRRGQPRSIPGQDQASKTGLRPRAPTARARRDRGYGPQAGRNLWKGVL